MLHACVMMILAFTLENSSMQSLLECVHFPADVNLYRREISSVNCETVRERSCFACTLTCFVQQLSVTPWLTCRVPSLGTVLWVFSLFSSSIESFIRRRSSFSLNRKFSLFRSLWMKPWSSTSLSTWSSGSGMVANAVWAHNVQITENRGMNMKTLPWQEWFVEMFLSKLLVNVQTSSL